MSVWLIAIYIMVPNSGSPKFHADVFMTEKECSDFIKFHKPPVGIRVECVEFVRK